MRIEFIPWSVNLEVQLWDDDNLFADRFYIRNDEMVWNLTGADARFIFDMMERVLGPPIIGGELAAYHPYWAERAARRAARQAT